MTLAIDITDGHGLKRVMGSAKGEQGAVLAIQFTVKGI